MQYTSIFLGIAAFALFALYDWCTVKSPGNAITKWGFYAAFLLVLLSVLFAAVPLLPINVPPVRLALSIILIALGSGGLIIVLFFSLPAGTYTDPTKKRKVYSGGAYGICRHPGFWPYLVIFTGLVLLLGKGMLLTAVLLCILNFLYILLQDVWTFRQVFEDYDDYSLKVPFLVPKFGKK